MFKHLFNGTAALALLCTPAFAQNAGGETVVVSATRLATPLSDVGSSVTVITADDIALHQQRSLADVLRTVPGLNIAQSGGAGAQTSVFLRGTNSSHTKVLLDGIDIGDPSNPTGAADISKLLAGDIARVEVLRGPQGALYGSDAIGGVISITTKTGEGPARLTASAEGGSFDTFNQSAALAGSDGAFHYTATLQHQHVGATPVTPLSLLLPGEKRNDDYYDNVTGSTRLGYDVSDALSLDLVGHVNSSLGKITNDAFDYVTYVSYPAYTRSRIATLQYDGRASAKLTLGGITQTLGLAYNASAISSHDPDNGNSLVAGNRIKLDWQGHGEIAEGQTLVLGAETARDAIHKPISFGITTNAGYAELNSDFGDGLNNSVSLRFDDNSRYGSKLTWHVAPSWTIGETRLKASAGSGFKAPSLQQLFGPYGHNPLLKPETSTGYDVGIEQGFLSGAASAGLTWFHNDIANLINYDATFTPINVDRARTQGVESFIAYKPIDALTLRADYTYTDAINAVTHAALLRRPRHKASFDVAWQALDSLLLDASLLYVGPRNDVGRESFAPEKLGAYTTVNLAATWTVSPSLALYGRVENLADRRYQDPDGFLRPGLGAWAGVKASL
ncbi:MAG: TonB-dependent receptor [Alphaproteobacteria bacterium]|nr:TonB-dependent receptor [Alphaproteobacteria bacterium]